MTKKLTLIIGILTLFFAQAALADYDYDDAAVLAAPFPQQHQTGGKHRGGGSSEGSYVKSDLTTNPGFADSRSATGNRVVIIDPKLHAWAAYNEDGKLVKYGRASAGANYCPDIHRRCHTLVGTFSVQSKGGAGCKSTRYPIGRGGALMPYCMFFTTNYALHGSYDVPPGRNASHGCVRMIPSSAAWLSQNFVKIGTTVIVRPY